MMCWLAPLLMLTDAASRAQSPENETDSLYLGNRVMLATSEPLQLTLNAHIEDFAWSPDGKRIAYWSYSKDSLDTSIRVIRPDGRQSHTYFQGHDSSDGDASEPKALVCGMFGWSPDANDFAFQVSREDPVTKRDIPALVIADTASGTLLYPSVPLASDTKKIETFYGNWSPNKDLFAYVVAGTDAAGHPTTHLFVYDAATEDTRVLLPSAADATFIYWIEGTHLLASGRIDGNAKRTRLIVDAITGEASPTNTPIDHAMIRQPGMAHLLNAGSAGMITLSNGYTFAPATDDQGKPHRKSVQLWVSVSRDAPSHVASSLSKAVVKPPAPPQLLIDSFRHAPENDSADITADPLAFAPAPGRPTGRAQLAYLISGDLYVSTISVRTPSVQELVAAGETLTCLEERQLAEENARQIGLAIVQYMQDYDDTLPMAENFHGEVTSYAEDESIFQIGDRKFHYLLDGDPMQDLGTPSETELGYFDLPCGRVMLYADSHVQVLDKDGKPIPP